MSSAAHGSTRAPRLLSIEGLRKSFGGIEVLHGLELHLDQGDFVGLMGANGAGKSTLIKILAGVHAASSGVIEVAGERVPSLAGRSDVAFIHQDLGLIDELSIADNLALGRGGSSVWVRRQREARTTSEALAVVNLAASPEKLVRDLAPGEKALVAIARALDKGAQILFVDEATSTLPKPDARLVLATLTGIAARGGVVVMVTHKLNEVLSVANRIVVLVDGVIAADRSSSEIDRPRLVGLLASHELHDRHAPPRQASGEVVLRADGAGTEHLRPMSLELRRGEIVGVTGLPGSGLYEVAYLLAGITSPATGTVAMPKSRPGFIPPHRETQGGFPGLTTRDNLAVSAMPRWRSRLRVLSMARLERDCRVMAETLNVIPRSLGADFMALSGGNKQKVAFGRVLATDPEVLILCEPTRGVDIATRQSIYAVIRGEAERGAAVFIVSSDAEDLFTVCQRVGVVNDGELSPFTDVGLLGVDQLEEIV